MKLSFCKAAFVAIMLEIAGVAGPVASCLAEITVGHVDNFQDSTTQSWLGANVEAVADAGPNGTGDTALRASATGAPFGANGKLVVFNDGDPWTGNWTAAGVAQISLDVRNPNAFPLAMRLAIAGPDRFFGGGGGDTHATDAITVAAHDAWHSITFDVLADDFMAAPLNTMYPDVAAALADVTHFRILHNMVRDFIGEAIDADFLIDNIRAVGASPMVSGDYNGNGTVDAADYVVWRKMLNQAVTPGSGADGTGPGGTPDGVVNDLDYGFWRSRFGSTSAAAGSASDSSVVPEPAAWTILLFLIPAFVRRQR